MIFYLQIGLAVYIANFCQLHHWVPYFACCFNDIEWNVYRSLQSILYSLVTAGKSESGTKRCDKNIWQENKYTEMTKKAARKDKEGKK